MDRNFGFGSESGLEKLYDLVAALHGGRNSDPVDGETELRGADIPRGVIALVVLIPQHYFIARRKPDSVIDGVVCLTGVPDQRNLIGRNAQVFRNFVARFRGQRIELRPIRVRYIGIFVAEEFGDAFRNHTPRRGAERLAAFIGILPCRSGNWPATRLQ